MPLQLKLQRAVALHQRGQLIQAHSLYQQILNEQPRHFDALHLMGVLAQHRGDSRRALELIDRALAIDAGNAVAHFNRGMALQALKRRREALESYANAAAIKPDFAEAYSNLGVVQTELRQWSEALASCGSAIAIRGNYAEAFFNRGNAQRELGRLHAAVADYDRAVAHRPGYASAYYNRRNVLRDLKQTDAALASYRSAMALDPDLEFLLGEWLSAKMEICEWSNIDDGISQLSAKIGRGEAVSNPFIVLALSHSPALQKRLRRSGQGERVRKMTCCRRFKNMHGT